MHGTKNVENVSSEFISSPPEFKRFCWPLFLRIFVNFLVSFLSMLMCRPFTGRLQTTWKRYSHQGWRGRARFRYSQRAHLPITHPASELLWARDSKRLRLVLWSFPKQTPRFSKSSMGGFTGRNYWRCQRRRLVRYWRLSQALCFCLHDEDSFFAKARHWEKSTRYQISTTTSPTL